MGFKDSHAVRHWEYNRELLSRPDRARDRWMRKHPGACPFCGSRDGMLQWFRSEFQEKAPQPDEAFYRSPTSDECIYSACPNCVPHYEQFIPMTHEEVMQWYEVLDA